MEVLFIWIEKYKNLIGKEFNFSSEYLFSLEFKNWGSVSIKIQRNEKFVYNFFDNHNIQNITALIGKNGSGKTNVMDFIKAFLAGNNTVINNKYNCQYIFIIKNFQNNKEIIDIYSSSDLIIGPVEYDDNNINCRTSYYSANGANILNESSIIFYSNIFDNRDEEDFEDLFNISTNYLLKKDYVNYANDNSSNLSETLAYKLNETFRQVEFISEQSKNVDLPLELPSKLFIKPNLNDQNYIEREEFKKYGQTIKYIDKLSSEFPKGDENVIKYFIFKIEKSILFNYFKLFTRYIDFGILSYFNLETYEFEENKILKFFEYLSNLNFKVFNGQTHSTIKFINFLKETIDSKNFKVIEDFLEIPITKKNLRQLKSFMKEYLSSLKNSNFLDFAWDRTLSSGEISLLTMYSRFNATIGSLTKRVTPLKDNILILIDEGEIYYHPEWQRKFISEFLKMLKFLFKNKKIQIIIASNSPFIPSDLPSNHIIYLSSDNSDTSFFPKEQTFFSNIHTMLSQNFYMNSTTGEFANQKIQLLIDFLNNQDIDLTKKTNMKKILFTIGEPIMRIKLEDMWIQKFGIEDEIILLEERINYLKNLDISNNNDQDK